MLRWGSRRATSTSTSRSSRTLLDGGRVAEALAIYSGALLDGFSLFANTAFDAWLSGERERLQHRAVRAAMVLAEPSERQR